MYEIKSMTYFIASPWYGLSGRVIATAFNDNDACNYKKYIHPNCKKK
jgi:hypothetical protein